MTTRTKVPVAKSETFNHPNGLLVTAGGIEIGIYRVKGKYYGWRNICPHAHAPVCKGLVTGTRLPSKVYEYIPGRDGEILRCPWHGWEFDLITGELLADGSAKLRGYEVVEEDGTIYVLV